MDPIQILTFDYLKNNKLAHVKVSNLLKQRLKNLILDKYGSLNKYNKENLHISRHAIALEFRKNKYFKFDRLLKIANDFHIPLDQIYDDISAFFARGSNTSKEIILPKKLLIDELFVEGYALYLAEGDNGSNGTTTPRKVRFTNSDLVVLKHFVDWLRCYFPDNYLYSKVLIPDDKTFEEISRNCIQVFFEFNKDQIKTQTCRWKRRTDFVYRVCLDSALLIDLILSIETKVKESCKQDKKLAAAYIRGMMIGEGTAYFNKSRYVRIEMRNEKEIKYLHELFTILGFQCKPSLRSERENMWRLYIGAKQLQRYHGLIGFGVHDSRQEILTKCVNKKLKVNQYG